MTIDTIQCKGSKIRLPSARFFWASISFWSRAGSVNFDITHRVAVSQVLCQVPGCQVWATGAEARAQSREHFAPVGVLLSFTEPSSVTLGRQLGNPFANPAGVY